jgi:acyl-CoA reductase-like NAD-dependent aldehyde dehydrogenase
MDEQDLDDRLARLRDHSDEWATLELSRKIEFARGFLERTAEVADAQVREAVRQKGLAADSAAAGEEWLSGPLITVRTTRHLIETLESLEETGSPPVDTTATRQRPDGQLVADVFPASLWDRVVYPGFSAEVWMQEGVDRQNLQEHLAEFYRDPDPDGAVSLVLGAGNVASIPPLDALHRLFTEGRVCMLKLNPVNDYLGEFYEQAFEEFIDAGYLDIAYGGAEVGDYLCHHDVVDDIHITGSDKTHDAIVFGTDDEAEERKERGEPKLDKPITSELGNVSPVILVPGPWSADDLQFHAENVATQLANNAGFNCNAARVLVMPEQWEHREAFMEALGEVFADLDQRVAYYPGARERFDRFTDLEADVEIIGEVDEDDETLPYAILQDVDPEDHDHPAFREEAWCTVMAETRLAGKTPGAFLANAVEFCNDVLWGTLNAEIIVHPETRRDLGPRLEDAIADLEYGNIALNHWPSLSYGLGITPWGAYPGQPLKDIQSGRGFVHNTLMFDKPQKSVIDGPFRMTPKPPWFATNDAANDIEAKLTRFERNPTIGKLLGVLWSTVFG